MAIPTEKFTGGRELSAGGLTIMLAESTAASPIQGVSPAITISRTTAKDPGRK
jgi:hypothetical protein